MFVSSVLHLREKLLTTSKLRQDMLLDFSQNSLRSTYSNLLNDLRSYSPYLPPAAFSAAILADLRDDRLLLINERRASRSSAWR